MASIENQLQKSVLAALGMTGASAMTMTPTKKGGVRITLDREIERELRKGGKEKTTLEGAIVKTLNAQGEVERLAFEADPTLNNKYNSLYKSKIRLIPDKLLKRIAIQDDLVAAIIQARQSQMSAFGRPRPDRFSTGFVIEPRQEALEAIEKIKDHEEKRSRKEELQRRISKVTKKMMSCGDDSLDLGGNQDKLTFPQYISMSIRSALVVGRLATEVLWRDDPHEGRVFAGIRVIDAGTIYRCEGQQNAAEAVRRQARILLAQLKNERLIPERYDRDEYQWVQVIDERPVQAFTGEECIVHNFFSVPDVELDGYPVTPLDTAISAVTTHLNITSHNKLYFQSGRAARGMLIIKSDDVDPDIVARVRQQFNAQINSVNNAWRMPVFGMGQEDDISWQPIDNSSRDMEFQYLADMNARVILSAFAISPEELPGWAYLSRGTNNQALSESNNEYKMEAARDVGIRPLLANFEDFLNQEILPLFDKELAKLVVIKLVGLDAETAEKESVRLQQDAPLHMTYDEILEKVEKKPVGKKMGGEYPLNPAFQAILDAHFTVGETEEFFMGREGASKDPTLAYRRDQFWMSWQQILMQQQQMQQQAAQQAAGGVQPPPGGDSGSSGGGGGDDGSGGGEQSAGPTQEAKTEKQKTADVQNASAAGQSTDLTRSLDQALVLLSKGEKNLPPSKRKLLADQKKLVADFLEEWESDAKKAQDDILGVIKAARPKA